MLDERHKKLLLDGSKLFSDVKDLHSFWQEVALQFYPEVATFTTTRSLGDEFADHLPTSFPLIARRTLGDALAALLRPVNLDTSSPGIWFAVSTPDVDSLDTAGKQWLEFATGIQRRAMYDRTANFVRATKEGDHFFATFGQCALDMKLNRHQDGLLYNSHHLKDIVWSETAEGRVGVIYRKWNPTASQLKETFGSKVSEKVDKLLKDNPHQKIDARHIVIPTDIYEQKGEGGKKFGTPFVSIWIDVENDHLIEEVGSHNPIYLIPRWVTVPGSQYASSPAVTAALPDARLIQAMTLTLLEASEKVANPPVTATQEIIRSDINLFAGGVTWVDAEYDERMGAALKPVLHHSGQGVGVGMEMRADVQEAIAKAFYLDSLSLPPASTKEMTAFEVGERISEWIRRAMPIFEPMEFEYNGALCENTFGLLLRGGAFGSLDSIPESLSGSEIQFKFESPLHEGADRRKGQKFLEAKDALVQAVEIDPSVLPMLDVKKALRDVLSAIAPVAWQRTESEVEEIAKVRQEQEAMQQALASGETAGKIARDLGAATKDFATSQEAGSGP